MADEKSKGTSCEFPAEAAPPEGSNGFATAVEMRLASCEMIFADLRRSPVISLELPALKRAVRVHQPEPHVALMLTSMHRRFFIEMREEAEFNKTAAPKARKFPAAAGYQKFLEEMFGALFVQPGFGIRPGEIWLADFLAEDLRHIFRWLGGEVIVRPDGSASDLSPFPAGPGDAAGDSSDRASKPLPAERAAGAAGTGSLPN